MKKEKEQRDCATLMQLRRSTRNYKVEIFVLRLLLAAAVAVFLIQQVS
ncbi:hypothetical protein [Algicola sagamiensis]|nr:hypothetical protein [Algicola sagamiensis]